MNFINIAGHLGNDPETRVTPSGRKVTSFRVATRTRKGGNDDTIWYRVTIWGDQFDKMITYLKKGSPVVVFGELQKPEMYTDREGKQHVSLDVTASLIQFSPFGKSDREGNAPAGQGAVQNPATQGAHQHAPSGEMPVNPYMRAPASQPSSMAPPMGMPQGNTYDDEVPF